ncbi:hypothetical protein O181_070198 [Austropuccinia psidii MF-1]|uniref:Uncharacterized protein n=1 Tax=Austropuccinia psidii MF-1 TaxID=1389203 RepID=A0A9Q3I719_9BASI|nr:hypothetical protein [Austropuccinia psidii MF-1]
MEPIQSNDNSNPEMLLTTTPDVSNMLASVIQLQQSVAFQISNFKVNVDRMKVSSVSQQSKVTFDTKQKASPKPSTKHKNSQRAISEPPPSTSSPRWGKSIAAPTSSTKSPEKQNPLQMQTADFPDDFRDVKVRKHSFSYSKTLYLPHLFSGGLVCSYENPLGCGRAERYSNSTSRRDIDTVLSEAFK